MQLVRGAAGLEDERGWRVSSMRSNLVTVPGQLLADELVVGGGERGVVGVLSCEEDRGNKALFCFLQRGSGSIYCGDGVEFVAFG